MIKRIEAFDYADHIAKTLRSGLLLNTNGDRFNSMVIGWGHIGVIWNMDTFTVYVRQSRFTKPQLDKTGEFTVSAPLDGRLSGDVMRICGSLSGRDIDKARSAGLTLIDPDKNSTPAILEYPLTLECRILYSQDQSLSSIPKQVADRFYGHDSTREDFHTAYIGEIVSAYIVEKD